MYKNVIFDFDGTVYDTVEGITKSVRYALNKHGMDAPLETLRCFAGPPLLTQFQAVFGVPEEQARQMVEDYRERYRPIGIFECAPFDGIEELLIALRAAGIRCAIASLKPLDMVEQLLERSGLRGYFDSVYGCGIPGDDATKRQKVLLAMAELGADTDNTILVGDTKYDVHGAHECGLKALGVAYGYAAPGEMEEAGADYMVSTVEELKDFLLR